VEVNLNVSRPTDDIIDILSHCAGASGSAVSLLPFRTGPTGLTFSAIMSGQVLRAGQQAIDFADVILTHGYSGARAYCQSKLAQVMFTFELAEKLAGTGVTATCLHSATYMDTAMVRRAGITPLSTVEQGAEAILNLGHRYRRYPAGPPGHPDEIAAACLFLVSDGACSITGETIDSIVGAV
jgi:NAD(P)-dependent dehydrogenase (short-subunit alcohol dehydrogenase family)